MAADDANLVRLARRGNEPAFRTLYDRYRTPLFRFVYRLAGSSDVAEDVTQECFLALIQGAGFAQVGDDLGDGGRTLADGAIDAQNILVALIQNGVDGDGGLAGLPVAED